MEKKNQTYQPADRYANLSPEAKLIAMAEDRIAQRDNSAFGRKAAEPGGKI